MLPRALFYHLKNHSLTATLQAAPEFVRAFDNECKIMEVLEFLRPRVYISRPKLYE